MMDSKDVQNVGSMAACICAREKSLSLTDHALGKTLMEDLDDLGYQITKKQQEGDKQYLSWNDVPDDLKQIVECLDSWPENNPTGVYLLDKIDKGMADKLGKKWARTFDNSLRGCDFSRAQFECAKSLKPEPWNGEGLPPIGTECEFKCSARINERDWTHGIVNYVSQYTIVVELNKIRGLSGEFISHPETMQFRPIRTEEERLYDEAVSELDCEGFIVDEHSTADEAIKILIQRGYINRPNN